MSEEPFRRTVTLTGLAAMAALESLAASQSSSIPRHLGTGRIPKTRAEKDAKKRQRKMRRQSKKRNRGGG